MVKNYKDSNLEEVLEYNFAAVENVFGESVIMDLIPGGRNIPVTSFNKDDFVEAKWEYELNKSI